MTYAASEAGVATGVPIELFDFVSNGTHYRYTSSGSNVLYGGFTYTATASHRNEIVDTGDTNRAELQIVLPRDNPFAVLFVSAPMEYEATVTVYRGHGSDWATYWMGRVSAVRFDTDQAVVICQPYLGDADGLGLRRVYCRHCPYALYGVECGLDKDDYSLEGVALTVSTTTITSAILATKEDGWFQGGMIYTEYGSRLIKTHVGSTITISHAIAGLEAGASFTAYAGCDHSMTVCESKFDNLLNYGGQPWLPTKNPFDGVIT